MLNFSSICPYSVAFGLKMSFHYILICKSVYVSTQMIYTSIQLLMLASNWKHPLENTVENSVDLCLRG